MIKQMSMPIESAKALPVAAKGRVEAKLPSPTSVLLSAAVTNTNCAAATGWLTSQVKLTRASAVGKSASQETQS